MTSMYLVCDLEQILTVVCTDMQQQDLAYVVSLLHSHVVSNEDYYSYVAPYHTTRQKYVRSQGRRTIPHNQIVMYKVGGHHRMKHCYKNLANSLSVTCKHEQLSEPRVYTGPRKVSRRIYPGPGQYASFISLA